TCGEGGALVMRDSTLWEKVRTIRLHGMTAAAYDRYTGTYKHWDMVDLGYKANMGDLQAALLLCQLPEIDAKLERRVAIVRKYDELLEGIAHPVTHGPGIRHAHHLYTVWVAPERR